MPAVGVLGESVEQLEPPPELRERVLAIVRSEAAASERGETEAEAARAASAVALRASCCGPRPRSRRSP